MATTMTLLQLRTAVRQRADQVNSNFISDAELTSYINQSAFELYDLLVQKYGDNYYVQTAYTFTTDGTNQFFALPADVYKLLGVDISISNSPTSFITVPQFNFSERNRYAVPNFQAFYGLTNMRYRLHGSNIWLNPLPAAGQIIQLYYIPRMTQLASDSDTFDGISGWTEYVIIDAAIKCMQKEESDVSVFSLQKQGIIARIESAAENRDAGSPATVGDTQYNNYGFNSGNGSGMGGSY